MTLALSWTDNQDGTGGQITIAGASGTVALQYVPLFGTTPTVPTVLNGLTNGTFDISLGTGFYLFAATSEIAVPITVQVTDNPLPVHERVVQVIKSRLQAMSFAAGPNGQPPSLAASQVYDQYLLSEANIEYPCIVLSMENASETQPGVLTGRDDIGYPVRLRIIARDAAQEAIANRPTYLAWRQQIFRAFRNQPLTGVPEIINVRVETQDIVDTDTVDQGGLASPFTYGSLILRAISREVRG